MKEKTISNKTINIFKLFLANFNLKIIDKPKYPLHSKIEIIDSNNNIVGNIHTMNTAFYLEVLLNENQIHAVITNEEENIIDNESNDILLNQRDYNINYQVTNDKQTISGELLINSIDDEHYGKKLNCHSTIKLTNNDEIITITILNKGSLLKIQYQKDNYHEVIAVKPFVGTIYHRITDGEYNIGRESFPYQYYACIYDNNDSLNLFVREEKDRNQINYLNKEVPRDNKIDSELDLIQKGMLMQEIDPNLIPSIKKYKEAFNLNDINILDSLMTISYNKYTDSELEALLDFKRDYEILTLLQSNTQNNKKLVK